MSEDQETRGETQTPSSPPPAPKPNWASGSAKCPSCGNLLNPTVPDACSICGWNAYVPQAPRRRTDIWIWLTLLIGCPFGCCSGCLMLGQGGTGGFSGFGVLIPFGLLVPFLFLAMHWWSGRNRQ